MEQFKYAAYASLYDYAGEPNFMLRYIPSQGAMSGKEAFERVITSPRYLMWEYELQHPEEKGK